MSATTPEAAQCISTAAEARDAFLAFSREVGSKADVWVHVSRDPGPALKASLNPKGLLDRWSIHATGDDFSELLENLRKAWAQNSEAHSVKTIREMALAIIALTADQGECTDAALRAKFDAADVTRYGERACEQATEMASNGPFSIVTLAGANDREAA